MKKRLSKQLAAMVCCLLISGFARGQQCTDLVSDGSFNGFNGVYNTFELCFNVPTWEATHGSPQIGGTGAHTPPYYGYLWGAVTTGEGISTNVTVTAGKKYVLTYWYRKSTISAYDVDHIYVKLFPSTVTYAGCNTGAPPTATPEQTIDHLTTVSTTTWTMSQVCFTANNNYSKLALFPMSNNQSYAVWLDVDDISLVEFKANAGPDATITNCCGSTVIGPSCDIPGASYSWSPTTGLDNPNVRNPVASPTTTTTYTLTVTGPNGCVATDQVDVTAPSPCPEFYHHVYGTQLTDDVTDGALAFPSTFPGNAMVAISETHTEQGKINVTRTDLDGRFNSIYHYNNQYSLARNSQSFDVATVYSAKLIFSPGGLVNAGEVMVMGDFTEVTSGPNHEIYFLHLDELGAVKNLYNFSDPQWSLYLGDFKQSPTKPTEIYVTGWAERNDEVRMFAFRFDIITSNIIWSFVYDIANTNFVTNDYGRDIIENPSNSSEILIVGNISDRNDAAQEDAFLLRLSANTGMITSMVDIYTNASDDPTIERFTSINATRGQTGFIIGGILENTDLDMWAVQTDAGGNMLWSNSRNYSSGGGTDEYNGIILERIGPANNVEFYQAGYTTGGNLGGQDIVVYKLDAGGMPMGEFTYGNMNNDRGAALDILPGNTTTDGLFVYGTHNTNGLPGINDDDGDIIKAYFSGHTACNYELNNVENLEGPHLYNTLNIWEEPFLTTTILHCKHITPIEERDICRSTCVNDGDNSRVIRNQEDEEQVALVIPNPMNEGTAKANIVLEVKTADAVTVTIYDLLGREYYSGAFSLVKGKNTLPVDVSNANMAPGMYSVKITGSQTNRSIILIVE